MGGARNLFAGGDAQQRLFAMPPASPFLAELARALVEATDAANNPAALADALIFTPNRRAARALAFELHRELTLLDPDAVLLAPDIRALGDTEETDSAASIGPLALGLPPAISPPRRRGALARLVQAWRRAQGDPPLAPASAIAAADELARLLDQSAMSGETDWSALLQHAPAADLAEHFRLSADFLGIVAKAWPNHLAEEGVMDAMSRRRAAAEETARRWAIAPPAHPVVIAGSTGAAAATRVLMRAVLTLPKGVVLIPGLDADLDAASWKAVATSPSHPQYILKRTLDELGVAPRQVAPWPGTGETGPAAARRRLINESLAPAETTGGWSERLSHLGGAGGAGRFAEDALSGLTLLEAEDESEEALVAALLLREALETPGRTAALVTPDAGLGRRVSALLRRWNIEAPPSAGEPLSRTAAGSLLVLTLRWAQDPADPVLLLAVLKHELTLLGRSRQDLQRIVSRLERRHLRGPRLDRTLDALAARVDLAQGDADVRRIATGTDAEAVEAARKAAAEIAALVADLRQALAAYGGPLADGQGEIDARAACEHLAHLGARLCATVTASGEVAAGEALLWRGRDGETAARWLEQLAELAAAYGPLDASAFLGLAEATAAATTAPPAGSEHPRIAIWGPLEARLQTRDRIILGGLNEGSWPRPGAADAFVSRKMRELAGLPDPDERIGLSAHDFAQLANAPEVFLLRAKRVENKPAVGSRWVWRLRTLAAGALGSDREAERLLGPAAKADPLAWARALRHVDGVSPARPPEPRPPVAARQLLAFSPTRVARLIRDPYSDYAQRILKLPKLERAGAESEARGRGDAVHRAIDAFEQAGRVGSLPEMIIERLIAAGASPELVEFERELWLRAASAYLDWNAERAPRIVAARTEEKASMMLATAAGQMKLEAKADRIEKLTDGSVAIIDFKTGQTKTALQVASGLEPQLPLEAAISAATGFGDLGPAPASELIYFRFTTGAAVTAEKNGAPLPFKPRTVDEIVADAVAGLIRLVGQYADPEQAYIPLQRAEFKTTLSDYDRLARRGEWAIEETDE